MIDKELRSEVTELPMRLSICLRSGDLVRRSLSIPVPSVLFVNLDEALRLKSWKVPLLNKTPDPQDKNNSIMADEVTVEASQQNQELIEFSIRYKMSGKELPNLGLVKLVFTKPELLAAVSGFDFHQSIALKSISVEIKDKNVTLNSELYKITDPLIL